MPALNDRFKNRNWFQRKLVDRFKKEIIRLKKIINAIVD